MPIVIGVDGGGTKTTCVVADLEFVLGMATAGGSNFSRLGEAVAEQNLDAAISDACYQTGIDPSQIDAAFFGLAGVARPEIRSAALAAAERLLPTAVIHVDTDVAIALQAAMGYAPGVVVIAGTGSIAYGRNLAGETARAGGLGSATSDAGSGYWIGREVVKELLKDSADSIPLTSILAKWKLEAREDLARLIDGQNALEFSELMPAILQASADPTVQRVLLRAGAELARLAYEVIQKLLPPGGVIRVAIAGGVFANSADVRRSFHQELRHLWPMSAVSFRISDPVQGAVQLARELAATRVSRK